MNKTVKILGLTYNIEEVYQIKNEDAGAMHKNKRCIKNKFAVGRVV